LYEILDGMLRLMSPILCFTAAEAWESLYSLAETAPLTRSVFFAEFPLAGEAGEESGLDERWTRLIRLRSEITKALEIARRDKIIGHPLEAEVQLHVGGELDAFIKKERQTLQEISIVSALRIVDGTLEGAFASEEIEGLSIRVVQAPGSKCERCWTRSQTVGEHPAHPEICGRCADVVEGMEPGLEG
jgi:isoleucyl-tRNA synthetase